MDKDSMHKKILEDLDYIRCPKCGNSLDKFKAKHSEVVPDNTIARLLMMSEEEVEKLYLEAIKMIRKDMANE